MKIGVVAAILPPDPGGLGETVWAKHRWLAARGVSSRIVTYAARPPRRAGDDALFAPEITRYDPVARVDGTFLEKVRDVRAMRGVLRDALGDCDLIEVQGWTLWNSALVLFPGPLRRKPWIMVYRGTDGWEYAPRPILDLKKRMNARAVTLANSAGLASHLRAKGLRVDGHIWSEVDPALFAPSAEQPDPGLLVTVKGLYPLGDPETLLRALGILKKKGIAFRHVHVGGGPLLEEMKALCAALGIGNRVEFLGTIPHESLPAILGRAAVKVLPSRIESCPHVVGEAMMMARPVVATATTGAAELIRDGETGLLANVGDPEDLAAKIVRVLGDPEAARAMGRRAHTWAMENLHVDVVFGKYLDVYQEALKARRL
jgi:glycosyltransferase involved in cell wall biosynthesis